MLKVRFIGREMHMEFHHPEKGVVRTSRVRDIHERAAASAAQPVLLRKAS